MSCTAILWEICSKYGHSINECFDISDSPAYSHMNKAPVSRQTNAVSMEGTETAKPTVTIKQEGKNSSITRQRSRGQH